jgi:hypothetical protein
MPTCHLPALLACLAGLPACVVPVGPEWVDPPENYPPTIAEATPAVGSVLAPTPDSGGQPAVRVVLADQNTRDNVYFRFIIDYPPFDPATSRVAWPSALPGGDQVKREPIVFVPSCALHDIASGFSSHRLLLAASDGHFVDDVPGQAGLDKTLDGRVPVEAMWPFELDCP